MALVVGMCACAPVAIMLAATADMETEAHLATTIVKRWVPVRLDVVFDDEVRAEWNLLRVQEWLRLRP